jgi:hypothetical protein
MPDEQRGMALAQELREALDDPRRYEWGEGPWEHLGDAEKDVRVLLDTLIAKQEECERLREALDAATRYIAAKDTEGTP